ncbi:calcium-activated BK potassium channel, alpha subunit [Planoprotostelium fungivorum]|uniref:Calcium-activated BK potassium channel, alpha subunit n=1 Tax=Planoprotostelium fungivorum TaxID=1890364 RepID=A0A2P6N6I8_9EUKA|nr:calcium-activated BK potassium channel, alpha subunit [Planoprotostelium fungivorum]
MDTIYTLLFTSNLLLESLIFMLIGLCGLAGVSILWRLIELSLERGVRGRKILIRLHKSFQVVISSYQNSFVALLIECITACLCFSSVCIFLYYVSQICKLVPRVEDSDSSNEEEIHRIFSFSFLIWLEFGISLWILSHFTVRYIEAARKVSFMFDVFAFADVCSCVPGLLGPLYGVYVYSFQYLRIVRLIQCLRFFLDFGAYHLSAWVRTVVDLGFVLGSLLFCSASILFVLENPVVTKGGQVMDFLDAIYTATVTLSTVGYGDVTPTSQSGKIGVMIIIACAIGVLPYFFGELINTLKAGSSRAYAVYRRKGHITVIARDSEPILSLLREIYHLDRRHMTRPFYAARVQILVGDPLKETSRGAISENPNQSSCTVSLQPIPGTQTTPVRNSDVLSDPTIPTEMYMKVAAVRRANDTVPIYVQTSRSHDKSLLSNLGVDVIMSTNDIRMGILAQATICPGFSAFVNNIVRSYKIPPSWLSMTQWEREYTWGACHEVHHVISLAPYHGLNYNETVEWIYERYNAVLIGLGFLKETENGRNKPPLLNPGPKSVITDRHTGIIIVRNRENVHRKVKIASTFIERERQVISDSFLYDLSQGQAVPTRPRSFGECLRESVEPLRLKRHVVVTGDRFHSMCDFVEKLRSYKLRETRDIVMLSPEVPTEAEWLDRLGYIQRVWFVRGNPTKIADLQRAGAYGASAAVILGHGAHDLDLLSADSKPIITFQHLIDGSCNPIIDLIHPSNSRFLNVGRQKEEDVSKHMVREFDTPHHGGHTFSGGSLNSLLAQSYFNPEVVPFLEQLVEGLAFSIVIREAYPGMVDRTYGQLFLSLLRDHHLICLGLYRSKPQRGVQSTSGQKVKLHMPGPFERYGVMNPHPDTILRSEDEVIVVISGDAEHGGGGSSHENSREKATPDRHMTIKTPGAWKDQEKSRPSRIRDKSVIQKGHLWIGCTRFCPFFDRGFALCVTNISIHTHILSRFYLLFSLLPMLLYAQNLTSLTSSPKVALNATNGPLRSSDGNWALYLGGPSAMLVSGSERQQTVWSIKISDGRLTLGLGSQQWKGGQSTDQPGNSTLTLEGGHIIVSWRNFSNNNETVTFKSSLIIGVSTPRPTSGGPVTINVTSADINCTRDTDLAPSYDIFQNISCSGTSFTGTLPPPPPGKSSRSIIIRTVTDEYLWFNYTYDPMVFQNIEQTSPLSIDVSIDDPGRDLNISLWRGGRSIHSQSFLANYTSSSFTLSSIDPTIPDGELQVIAVSDGMPSIATNFSYRQTRLEVDRVSYTLTGDTVIMSVMTLIVNPFDAKYVIYVSGVDLPGAQNLTFDYTFPLNLTLQPLVLINLTAGTYGDLNPLDPVQLTINDPDILVGRLLNTLNRERGQSILSVVDQVTSSILSRNITQFSAESTDVSIAAQMISQNDTAQLNFKNSTAACVIPQEVIQQVSNGDSKGVYAVLNRVSFNPLPDPNSFNIMGEVTGVSLYHHGREVRVQIAEKLIEIHVPLLQGHTIVDGMSCFYWSEDNDAWKSDGCSFSLSNNGSAICSCSHLTNFTVGVSLSSAQVQVEDRQLLDTSIVISIVVGAAVLITIFIIILFFVFKWKRDKTYGGDLELDSVFIPWEQVELHERLHESDNSVVYRGTFQGGHVALKSHKKGGDREREQRLYAYYGFTVSPTDEGYILLELANLGCLTTLFPSLTSIQILQIAMDISSAVGYLHEQSFSLKNLSVSNILVSSIETDEIKIKLCDLSEATQDTDTSLDISQFGYLLWEVQHQRRRDPAETVEWSYDLYTDVAERCLLSNHIDRPKMNQVTELLREKCIVTGVTRRRFNTPAPFQLDPMAETDDYQDKDM